LKYKKTYDKIFLNSDVNKYLPQLMTYLTNNKINFADPHLNQIHFQNGYWDFETGKFDKITILLCLSIWLGNNSCFSNIHKKITSLMIAYYYCEKYLC
jgi:hypothetical protein